MNTEEFFAAFTRSAWRLETLPAYGTPTSDPAFAGWVALGGQLPPLEQRPAKVTWMAAVRQAVAEGRQLGRVHVLRRPLSPFLEYELATYPENIAAGEDVRIADEDTYPELADLGGPDFWLLDDQRVLVLDYDHEGRFLAMHQTRDPVYLDMARRRRDFTLARSVTLEEFLQPA